MDDHRQLFDPKYEWAPDAAAVLASNGDRQLAAAIDMMDAADSQSELDAAREHIRTDPEFCQRHSATLKKVYTECVAAISIVRDTENTENTEKPNSEQTHAQKQGA